MTGDDAIGSAADGLSPRDRIEAERSAADLTRRLEFLPWVDRAAVLDSFYWSEARDRLSHELVTAVIARAAPPGREAAGGVRDYAWYCRTVTGAVLDALGEPARIEDEAAALTHRLSPHEPQAEAGEAWLDGEGRREALLPALACRPGYAFLLLAMNPSDSAESFTARDAFLAAMLGRG